MSTKYIMGLKGNQACSGRFRKLYKALFIRSLLLRVRGDQLAKDLNPTSYQQLVASLKSHAHKPQTSEAHLDQLLTTIQDRERKAREESAKPAPDPIQALRELVVQELIPVFVELVEKYSQHGISMQMDASNLLEGGRELAFEFGIGSCRIQLQGTVTQDAIAFHEVRHSSTVQGQLMAGPMLRQRNLDANSFREFICDRLTVLLRFAGRRK